jgi:hypothetical protein
MSGRAAVTRFLPDFCRAPYARGGNGMNVEKMNAVARRLREDLTQTEAPVFRIGWSRPSTKQRPILRIRAFRGRCLT